MLTVYVYQLMPRLSERGDIRGHAVYAAGVFAVQTKGSAKKYIPVLVGLDIIFLKPRDSVGGNAGEECSNARGLRAGSDKLARRAFTEHGVYRIDYDRLARAGFARKDIEPRIELDIGALNYCYILYFQTEKHSSNLIFR